MAVGGNSPAAFLHPSESVLAEPKCIGEILFQEVQDGMAKAGADVENTKKLVGKLSFPYKPVVLLFIFE